LFNSTENGSKHLVGDSTDFYSSDQESFYSLTNFEYTDVDEGYF